MNVAMILTLHDELGNTGHKTGFSPKNSRLRTMAFVDARASVTLAPPKGGQPPLAPKSDEPGAQTEAIERFKKDPAAQELLKILRK